MPLDVVLQRSIIVSRSTSIRLRTCQGCPIDRLLRLMTELGPRRLIISVLKHTGGLTFHVISEILLRHIEVLILQLLNATFQRAVLVS